MKTLNFKFGFLLVVLILGQPLHAAKGAHSATTEPLWESERRAQAPSSFVPEISPEDIDVNFFFGPSPEHLGQYLLGVEDLLSIRVFELDQLDVTVRVSGDGTVGLPLVGSVRVQGLTTNEVAQLIQDRLKDVYLENPQVSVFIQEFNSRKVFLLGAVLRPDEYSLTGRRNLLQLLSQAGGLQADAGKVLYVFRQTSDGRTARLTIPRNSLQVQGDARYNIWLLPGDVISVPTEEVVRISVLGAVRNPGIYELPVSHGGTLLNAIARAGGLDELASKSGIHVIRRAETGEETIIPLDLGNILLGKEKDLALLDGDIVFVKESFW